MKYGEYDTILDENKTFEFDNVCFRYNENSNYAVSNISFSITKGMSVGIIGGTGSGKSTLVNLMNRFYDCNSGKILFYGRDISSYKKGFVNNKIALVPQKAVLFSGSIRKNLLWGKKDAKEEELYLALKNSQALEFVLGMEDKLDTVLYQGGKNLSGGQKQRLSIARALVKNSDILILDDSSSALDFKTEANLRASIKSLNKTTITISQRASSIMHSDLIIVLDQGNIVGIGKHNELINSCDVYKEICDSQDLKEDNYA